MSALQAVLQKFDKSGAKLVFIPTTRTVAVPSNLDADALERLRAYKVPLIVVSHARWLISEYAELLALGLAGNAKYLDGATLYDVSRVIANISRILHRVASGELPNHDLCYSYSDATDLPERSIYIGQILEQFQKSITQGKSTDE